MSEQPIRNRCKVCGNALFEAPLLRFENMPGAAQHLPDAATVADDRGVDLEVCQCSGCGLVQLTNDPVPYYRDVIRAAAFSEEMKGFRIGQFSQFVEQYQLKGRKVLEIGCGKGEYLSLMQECGAEAYGIEHAAASVTSCLQSGLRVSRRFLEGELERLHDGPFDAFFILNFLEHIPDLNAALRGIRCNLAEGGIGLVEVPNFDSIIEKCLFSEFIGDHLYYFTEESLRSVLVRNGFEVIACQSIWYDYILSAVVRKRQPLDLSQFQQHQCRLAEELHGFVGKFPAGKVAVWGAGHQALAVLTLAKLNEKIRYVIDSAPFKQGKYTPATHIPIVPPDTLQRDPVDAVIVMAASYSDEVAGILRQRHGRDLQIAILRSYGLETL